MREDRFILGSSPDVPDLWSDVVLRQLAESTRQQTRAGQWTSRDRLGAAGRTLALLLSRRGLCRVLSNDCVLVSDGATAGNRLPVAGHVFLFHLLDNALRLFTILA